MIEGAYKDIVYSGNMGPIAPIRTLKFSKCLDSPFNL